MIIRRIFLFSEKRKEKREKRKEKSEKSLLIMKYLERHEWATFKR